MGKKLFSINPYVCIYVYIHTDRDEIYFRLFSSTTCYFEKTNNYILIRKYLYNCLLLNLDIMFGNTKNSSRKRQAEQAFPLCRIIISDTRSVTPKRNYFFNLFFFGKKKNVLGGLGAEYTPIYVWASTKRDGRYLLVPPRFKQLELVD